MKQGAFKTLAESKSRSTKYLLTRKNPASWRPVPTCWKSTERSTHRQCHSIVYRPKKKNVQNAFDRGELPLDAQPKRICLFTIPLCHTATAHKLQSN